MPVIAERAEALSGFAEELFRYSVITSPEYDCRPEPVVLNEVLEESVLGFYASLSERGITPEIHITERKIIRNVNRVALLRVFSNVLNNAVKYSSGDLNISMDDSGVIGFSNTAENLSEIQVERLFDRFYTRKRAEINGLGVVYRQNTCRADGRGGLGAVRRAYAYYYHFIYGRIVKYEFNPRAWRGLIAQLFTVHDFRKSEQYCLFFLVKGAQIAEQPYFLVGKRN